MVTEIHSIAVHLRIYHYVLCEDKNIYS